MPARRDQSGARAVGCSANLSLLKVSHGETRGFLEFGKFVMEGRLKV
jgi:hypothetical protein